MESNNSDENDLFRCSICGITESDSSNLTQTNLQTNATIGCGHQFCPTCVERELSLRKTFSCPICDTIVKRSTLSTRSLDDIQCEKDTSWRRRIMKIYNKVEGDFETLNDYNDYLEQVEDLIYAIVNSEPNAEECKMIVKKFEEENKSEIAIRQSQRADEDRLIQDKIVEEQREVLKKKKIFRQDESERKRMKARYQKEATQVKLGEREMISQEVMNAHLAGYDMSVLRKTYDYASNANGSGRTGAGSSLLLDTIGFGPRVREPIKGLHHDRKLDREFYIKRQAAGGGLPSNSIQTQERNWDMTVSTLFCS